MEELELLAVPIEIRIGLANQILNGCAISIRHRLIHQREASLTVFGKNKVRINVDNLPEECPLLLQRLLGAFPYGNIHDRRQHEEPFLRVDGIESNFNQNLTAILPPREQISTRAHGPGLGRNKEFCPVCGMATTEPLRHKHINRLPN